MRFAKEFIIGATIATLASCGANWSRAIRNDKVDEKPPVMATATPEPVKNIRLITIHNEKINGDIPEEPYYNAGTYTITGYCPCVECCGEYAKNRPNGIVKGSAGVELKQGYSVASPLPNGTKIEIEGMGVYEVQDTPAEWINKRYNNRVIDVYFNKHEDAQYFKTTRKIRIIK